MTRVRTGASSLDQRKKLKVSLAAMYFPFCFGDTHEHLGVFDGDPTGKNFHDVLKVRFENNVSHAVNKSGRRSVQNVKTLTKSSRVFRLIFVLRRI